MRRLITLLVAAGAALLGQKYTFFESDHFELLTDGSKGRAQEILGQFERVRAFFVKTRGFQDPPMKPRVVVFSTEKEFREYAHSAIAAAYYIGLPQRDYIAIGPSASAEDKRVAVHEYVHMLNRYGDTELPIWMNEGIAELYSNIEAVGKKIRVGTPIPQHVYTVNQQWLPLEDVVDADTKSGLYNRRQHAGPFYGIAWALVHMLTLDPRYSAKFNELYNEIGAGSSSKDAMEKVYGKALRQIEDDARAYMKGLTINVVMFDVQFDKVDKVTPRPAAAYDWIVDMAALKQGNRDFDGALQRLEAMVKSEPARPEAHEAMAFVHMMDHSEKSTAAYRAARKTGSRNPNLGYWAPSMLRDHQASIEVLRETIAAHPNFVEARLRLAAILMGAREPQAAYDELKQLKRVNRKQASSTFLPTFARRGR
ncbi:MAG: hypothetical protein FJW30_24805 [Acidobacteria bacterium]|nr:hypothetical protein [Acidobacteriota bacterium]